MSGKCPYCLHTHYNERCGCGCKMNPRRQPTASGIPLQRRDRPRSTSLIANIEPCPVIYLAGPMRAANPWLWELNIRAAEEWSLRLYAMGVAPIVPHTMNRYFDKALPDEIFLGLDYSYLDVSHAIFLIPNWENSKGSVAEREYAEAIDLKVLTHLDWVSGTLHTWIRDWKAAHARTETHDDHVPDAQADTQTAHRSEN